MSELGSPLRLGPSSSKRSRVCFNFEKCIVCQRSSNESVTSFTVKSKCSFFSSLERRNDEICQLFVEEYGSFAEIPMDSLNMVYHRSCYKSYTSKHNVSVSVGNKSNEALDEETKNRVPSARTRSQSILIDWNACIICNNKSYKKDKKLIKIESDDRVGRILSAAHHYSDFHLISKISQVDFKENVTLFTAMKKCLDMSNEAGQAHAIQTFDQQLYAIAQQVKWSRPDIFESHILRLGGFHTLSCFITSLGKLWADGGLRDLLVDSGVYAGSTAEQMLTGKQFNRAVRGFHNSI
ncbi:unnamed protein product [Mytilus edulis]|uniref:Uncharacterized protein n=1 Tax=Mytilus edulis TaxID=6550 RepID=A0A8S3REU9_MYTED|nr:unnamed protein product [Mytilus edulis]